MAQQWRGSHAGQMLAGRGDSIACLAMADFDADGDLDLVGGHESGGSLWVNDGVGNLAKSEQVLGDDDIGALAVGDFDGDGDREGATAGSKALSLRTSRSRWPSAISMAMGTSISWSATEAYAMPSG